MADGPITADNREHLISELRPAIRSELFEGVPNVSKEFRRYRGDVDRILPPEKLDPSHTLIRITYRVPPTPGIFLAPAW